MWHSFLSLSLSANLSPLTLSDSHCLLPHFVRYKIAVFSGSTTKYGQNIRRLCDEERNGTRQRKRQREEVTHVRALISKSWETYIAVETLSEDKLGMYSARPTGTCRLESVCETWFRTVLLRCFKSWQALHSRGPSFWTLSSMHVQKHAYVCLSLL